MGRKLSVSLSALLGTCLMATSQGLVAQEESSTVLEEIVVTASKRESTLQDVAQAITALTGEELQNLSVQDFNEYIELVPGLTAGQRTPETNGPRTVGLRGVQSLNGTFSVGQNTVGFYVDDAVVPISNPRLVDLERMEVLRGPQGTLYGSSTLAGVIKLVTAPPQYDQVVGRVSLEASGMSDGGTGYSAEGYINVPVSANFALRFSGYVDRIPGYVDVIDVDIPTVPTGNVYEDANEVNSSGGRILASWQASDDLELRLSYMFNETEVDNLSIFSKPTAGGLPATGCFAFNFLQCPDPTLGIPALAGNPTDRDDPRLAARFLTPSSTEFDLLTFTIDWSLNNADLVSSTSWYNDEGLFQSEITDIIGATFGRDITVPLNEPPFFAFQPAEVPFKRNLENSELTHETRLLSNWDHSWDYTVGVFYTDRDEDFITTAPLGVGTSLYGFPNLSEDGSALATDGYRGREELSFFGELTWNFTDQFSATAGLRYYDHKFKLRDVFTGNPLFVGVPSGTSARENETSDDGWLGAVRLSYRANENALLYGSVSEGFRMGGAVFKLPEQVPSCQAEIMAIFGTDTAPDKFESDDLVNYELGWKQVWASGRSTTNLAAFYIDWNNTQVNLPAPVCNIVGFPVNAGAVESSGVEFEWQTAVTDSLVVGMQMTYINAEVKDDLTTSGAVPPIAVAGDPMPDIPEWSGAINWDWRFGLTDTMQGYFRGFFSYRDETVVAIGVDDNLTDSYVMANLRLGTYFGDGWDVALFVNNALDERPSLTGPIPLDPEPNAFRFVETSLQPRSYGVTLTKRWE